MKQTFVIAVILSSFLISCSSDDDKNSNSQNAAAYFPEVQGNYWTYNVETAGETSRDSLYVLKDTIINSKTYKKLDTRSTPFGFLSSSLNQNGMRVDGNKILLSGDLGLDFSSELPIKFELDDFVMFKEDAGANEQLSAVSGTMQQNFGEYPVTIDYTLKSTAQAGIPSFTAKNGETYHDIKPVLVTLQLKMSASFAGMPITILNTQNVVSSMQYYVKNIGVVYTNTVMSYQLSPLLAQLDPNLPLSGSESQEETIHTYQVNR